MFSWSKKAVDSQHWSLTAKRVLPYIDGFHHVQKIAALANVDLTLVRSALQTLVFHGVLLLTPIFTYSNMYSVKPDVYQLYHDQRTRDECVRFVAIDSERPPEFRDVFSLYCALGPGISVGVLCGRYDLQELGVDEKKLILFGIVRKFIHKLRKWPVLIDTDSLSLDVRKKAFLFKGRFNYDEIACLSATTGTPFSHETIDTITENDQQVVHIWK